MDRSPILAIAHPRIKHSPELWEIAGNSGCPAWGDQGLHPRRKHCLVVDAIQKWPWFSIRTTIPGPLQMGDQKGKARGITSVAQVITISRSGIPSLMKSVKR